VTDHALIIVEADQTVNKEAWYLRAVRHSSLTMLDSRAESLS
jgi:hypothetical protein